MGKTAAILAGLNPSTADMTAIAASSTAMTAIDHRYGGCGCFFYRYDGYCSLCNCASSYLRKYRCIRLPA